MAAAVTIHLFAKNVLSHSRNEEREDRSLTENKLHDWKIEKSGGEERGIQTKCYGKLWSWIFGTLSLG